MLRRLILTAGLILVAGLLQPATPARADHTGASWPTCGGGTTTHCVKTFLHNGAAASPTFANTVSSSGGLVTGMLTLSGSFDLSPTATTASVFTIELNIGTSDPFFVGSTGDISSVTFGNDGSGNTVTIVASPRAASWHASCTTASCPSVATFDFSAMLLFAVGDSTLCSTAPADAQAACNSMVANGKGMWFSTNAQAMSPIPTYVPGTNAIEITVAAPSFKTDGVTANTGFFKFFAPNSFVTNVWGVADPSSLVTGGTVTVTRSDGKSVGTVSVTQVSGGILVSTTYEYSTPKFSMVPVIPPGGPCGLALPVLVTWHGSPVRVGVDLMYGSKADPQSTSAPFQVTDPSGQAAFLCLPAGDNYLLRVKWGEADGVHVGLTDTLKLKADNTIQVETTVKTLELREPTPGKGQVRVDIHWLRGSEVEILPHVQ